MRDKNGQVFSSAENALWIDHKVIPLNLPIAVEMPLSGGALGGKWHVTAKKQGHAEIDLIFTPKGLHEDHAGHRALGIVSDFVQPHGSFSGSIKVKDPHSDDWLHIKVENVYGVCEDHHAIW